MTDSLLQRVAAGDRSAVQACIDRYGALIWTIARRFSESPADAEDAVQDIFIAIWQNAARFDQRLASERTFVTMIARRRLIDHRRRSQRRPAVQLLSDDPAASTPPNPAELTEEAAQAARALAGLRPDEQRVVRLAVIDGLSHAEIADRTGLPLGTVKTHIRRGLVRIREMLGASEGPARRRQGVTL